MVERSKKPSEIPISPSVPAPLVTISHDNSRVVASLPVGDRIEVLLHGATVVSWKSGSGKENLFLSSKAHLDGSKPVRGGIPLVFPLFGPPSSSHEPTSKLPQHGFARSSRWEYLGKTSSESFAIGSSGADASVKLDFGLSDAMLDEKDKAAWPHAFGLTYSITLSSGELATSLQVANTGASPLEFRALFHTYLAVQDISTTTVSGLESLPFIDKVSSSQSQSDASNTPLTFTSETDRIYSNPASETQLGDHEQKPVTVLSSGRPVYEVRREGLGDVVVWNPWSEKAKGMSDFAPEDAWKKMVCVEAGSVARWNKLEGGETWEGRQAIRAHI
ncbi:MAG: hypothetical protein LQ340_005163 [Diploschistes diacapsis]|nr:MAG: hypothetical protein LQ340_005163 [Diploschistes diacapsis]